MRYRFILDDIDDVQPWGEDQPTLHWFGLTSGWYWIEVAGQALFRHNADTLRRWASEYPVEKPMLPYVGYYVVRLWEDVLEMLPAVLDPVPDDLAARLARPEEWDDLVRRAQDWLETQEDDAGIDAWFEAFSWWGQRALDAGYLTNPPRVWMWRAGETIHVRWDNRGAQVDGAPVWEAAAGQATLPVSGFVEAVRQFDSELMAAMAARVDAIRQHWSRPEIAIDLDQLVREQIDRATWLSTALRVCRPAVDWEMVRKALAELERRLR